MTLDDILGISTLWSAYLRPAEIRSRFYGRICISPHLWVLCAVRELMAEECKVYLEIGVMHGGSMCVAIGSKYPCTHIGIDPFNGFYGTPVDPLSGIAITQTIAQNNIATNNLHEHPFYLMKGKSTDEDILDCVKEHYPAIDLLFIDGDHSEEGVKADFENYGALVGPGGIVVCDNYQDPAWPGVKEAMEKVDLSNWNVIGIFGYAFILEKKENTINRKEKTPSTKRNTKSVESNQEVENGTD